VGKEEDEEEEEENKKRWRWKRRSRKRRRGKKKKRRMRRRKRKKQKRRKNKESSVGLGICEDSKNFWVRLWGQQLSNEPAGTAMILYCLKNALIGCSLCTCTSGYCGSARNPQQGRTLDPAAEDLRPQTLCPASLKTG